MIYCNRCGRELTDPASRKAGYGPACLAEMKSGKVSGNRSSDAVAKLPFSTDTMDIVCRRGADGAVFNIPQALVLHSPTGMGWGYAGSGAADFALNILYRFTQDRRFSEEWHQAFKAEFVASMPERGGVIKGATINAWIRRRRGYEHAKSLLLPGIVGGEE